MSNPVVSIVIKAGKFSRDWRFEDVMYVYRYRYTIHMNIQRYGKSSIVDDMYDIYIVYDTYIHIYVE